MEEVRHLTPSSLIASSRFWPPVYWIIWEQVSCTYDPQSIRNQQMFLSGPVNPENIRKIVCVCVHTHKHTHAIFRGFSNESMLKIFKTLGTLFSDAIHVVWESRKNFKQPSGTLCVMSSLHSNNSQKLKQKADSAPRVEQRSIPEIQQHIRNCRVSFYHTSAVRNKVEKKWTLWISHLSSTYLQWGGTWFEVVTKYPLFFTQPPEANIW